jgi:hypothetical protein
MVSEVVTMMVMATTMVAIVMISDGRGDDRDDGKDDEQSNDQCGCMVRVHH